MKYSEMREAIDEVTAKNDDYVLTQPPGLALKGDILGETYNFLTVGRRVGDQIPYEAQIALSQGTHPNIQPVNSMTIRGDVNLNAREFKNLPNHEYIAREIINRQNKNRVGPMKQGFFSLGPVNGEQNLDQFVWYNGVYPLEKNPEINLEQLTNTIGGVLDTLEAMDKIATGYADNLIEQYAPNIQPK